MDMIKKYREFQLNKKLKKICGDDTYASSKPSLSSLTANFSASDNKDGTDKDTIHSYIQIYEKVFSPIRDNARYILEIGIYSGAFLKILSDYFDNAQIYGIDINTSNLRFAKDDQRVHIFEMDGTDENSMKNLGIEYFDLIIEDGSHIPNEQVATFRNFAPLLGPRGIYIMEDINATALKILRPQLKHISDANKMDFEFIDLRYIKGRYDDICMIAIKKGD
jgi:spermidine synthase